MKEYSILIISSEELKREVKVYVSLPEGYYESNKSYPVLYVTDGQVLFKEYDNYIGQSWGIMEQFMSNPNRKEIIIVGIGTNENRNDELLPFSFVSKVDEVSRGGNANALMQFITTRLIPKVDSKYRTMKSSEFRGLLGMSVGGVFSSFASTKYTEYFSRFASISTAFIPVHNQMVELLKSSTFDSVERLYLDVGTKESENQNVSEKYLESNTEVHEILKTKIDSNKLKFRVIENAKHDEKSWSKRFPDIIDFLFTS